ncbi:MAG: prephenate dehydratase [Candidatus Saganbacteria bacterium]|nr:prephenate dehydratase [Candidatus Saganbacteria bacterium]
MTKKIGYLGPEGTFSEEAGQVYLKKLETKADLVPMPTFHDVLFAVDREEVDEGIVPVENSIEGTVGVVQDMLAKEVDLKIKGEIILPVHQSLMAKKDITLSEIKEVISFTQPIEQCRTWLRKNLPHAKIRFSSSTSEAARTAASSAEEGIAAIGSSGSAKIYGLKVLLKDITDYSDNATRFIVLSKTDHKPTGSDKTSIVFSVIADKPGGLFAVLGEFASRGINLTKIESRPSKKALGDYFFFVDMEGHRKDKMISEAVSDITNKVAFLKILGSYPKGGA